MPQTSETPALKATNALLRAVSVMPDALHGMDGYERDTRACRLLLTALIDLQPEYHEALSFLLEAEKTLDDDELATAYDEAATDLQRLMREAEGRAECSEMNRRSLREDRGWMASQLRQHVGFGR